MATKKNRIYSDYASPPGEFLQEESEARGISTEKLAECCEESVDFMNEIFRGAREITPELAAKLEAALLGIGAYLWLNLEEDYQETLRRNGESRPE